MTLSFNWLREINKDLQRQDAIPLTSAPPFPWEELSENLARIFECDNLNIQPKETQWRSKEDLLKDLAQPVTPVALTISSLKGKIYWVMPKEEIDILESLLLTRESNFTIDDPHFKEGFYHFLILETLNAINQTSFDPSLVPVLTDQNDLPAEDALCLDLSFTLENRLLSGRLVISSDLRQAIADYFSQKGAASSPVELAKKVELPLHLEIGKTQFSLDEWKEVSLGDFIILDSCTLQPEDLSGQLLMTVRGRPAFRGEISGNQIKILEFPAYHEEDTVMAKHEDEDEDDDFSDLDFEEEDEDDEFDEFDEELFEDLEEEDAEHLEKDEMVPKAEPEKAKPAKQSDKPEKTPSEETLQLGSVGSIRPDQLPMKVVVELGCVQMTMDKLLQIEPGNLLDISVHPENGVDLTVNGRVIAKGELVRIGENLGVRILELG